MGKKDRCCVLKCDSRRMKNPGLSFFEVPSAPADRRLSWIRAINREDTTSKARGKLWIPGDSALVCSLHFVSGRPQRSPQSVDYIPTIGLGYDKKISLPRISAERIVGKRNLETCQTCNSDSVNVIVNRKSCTFLLEGSCDSGISCIDEGTQMDHTLCDVGCQTDSFFSCVNADVINDHDYCTTNGDSTFLDIKATIQSLNSEIELLKTRITLLSNRLDDLSIGASSMEHFSNDAVRLYTGFPSFTALAAFYHGITEEVEKVIKIGEGRGASAKISRMDQFILVMVRLKLGLVEKDIGARFGISQSYVSKIFNAWIPFLSHCLQDLHCFPTLEQIKPCMLPSFDEYPNTRFIIDCTELFIQKPSLAISQTQTWSSYKHHNTAKALVAITPDGFMAYISKLFSGSTSDREIVESSGFLDLIDVGDGVMADRGFNIDDLLIPLGATLNIPAFKGQGRTQLSYEEVFDSRRIASARIHVERVIGRVKTFNIINGTIPLASVPLLNDIFLVCCYMVNYQTPVVKIE